MHEEVTELKYGYTWELAAGSVSGSLSRLKGAEKWRFRVRENIRQNTRERRRCEMK